MSKDLAIIGLNDRWALDAGAEKAKLESIRAMQNSYLYMKNGDNEVRILPPYDPVKRLWYKEYALHFGVSSDNLPTFCLDNWGEACFICEQQLSLKETGDKDADSLKATRRIYVNALDMSDIKSGVQIAVMPVTVLEKILEFVTDPKWGNLMHPISGRAFTITKSGQGVKGTKYAVKPYPHASPIPDMKVLDKLYNLESVGQRVTYEQMKGIFKGNISVGNALAGAVSSVEDSPPFDIPESGVCSAPVSGDCPLGTFGKFDTRNSECISGCPSIDKCVQAM